MTHFPNDVLYEGFLFSYLPVRLKTEKLQHSPISFAVLPLSYIGSKNRLIKQLSQLKEKCIGTGLWIPVPGGEDEMHEIISFLSRMPKGLLTYPVFIRTYGYESKHQILRTIEKVRQAGFYPVLWVKKATKITKADLCCSTEESLSGFRGVTYEKKVCRVKGTVYFGYHMYTHWDYPGFIRSQGWNI